MRLLHLNLLRWSPFVLFGGLIYWHYKLWSLFPGQDPSLVSSDVGARKVAAPTETDPELIWNSIRPSEHLSWVDCYSGFQCARFKVPLNYSEPDGPSAALALIRLPAPDAHLADYRGPILFNPGGPGGSGVDFLLQIGRNLSHVLGPQFDLVGFDPRGVFRSTPSVSFFKTAVERELFGNYVLTALNESKEALPLAYARVQLLGQLAEEQDDDLLIHINTENTARDMLRITEANGKEKLQYWGFSYGSILGATFAAMFPDRVERIIIDAVADADNYFATLWSNNLADTNKTMQAFFDGCTQAGPKSCAFYAPTAGAVEDRLRTLYETIRLRPVHVRTSKSYGLVDYWRLRFTVFRALYKPYAQYQLLAQALADLETGNGTTLYQMSETPLFNCACDSPITVRGVQDAGTAIACTDGEEVHQSLEETWEYYIDQARISEWAELWTGIRMSCVAWPKQSKTHFRGPFVGNTSHPILLIGNTADPVTPVRHAHKMAQGFPGSVVLTQDSPGHGSLAAPSLCTHRIVKEYFVSGTLPKVNTTCPVDGVLFPQLDVGPKVDTYQSHLSAEDATLRRALPDLSRSFGLPLPL